MLKASTATYMALAVWFARRLIAKCTMSYGTRVRPVFVAVQTITGGIHVVKLGRVPERIDPLTMSTFARKACHMLRDARYREPAVFFNEASMRRAYTSWMMHQPNIFPTTVIVALATALEEIGGTCEWKWGKGDAD